MTNPKGPGRFNGGRRGRGEAVGDGATEGLRELLEEGGSQPRYGR